MRILFFCEDAVIDKAGGVQNVTALWRNYFIDKGHKVFIVYKKNHSNLSLEIPQTKLPSEKHNKSKINIDFLSEYIKDNEIQLVINQAAQGPLASYVCLEACRLTETPFISIVHNSPDALIKRILSARFFSAFKPFKSIVELLLPSIIRNLPRYGSRRLVRYSSAVVVLAPEYIEEYKRLYVGGNSDKIVALHNPVCIDKPDGLNSQRDNIALFVGRLSEQKGVDKILKIWKTVETQCSDAKLYIVGDGELKTSLKELAENLKLQRVYFEGYRDPNPYYERSKVFLMTSIYEGLPMTLLECQKYGVVPIVIDSFMAARGILGDDLKEFIISQDDEAGFCNKIIELFKNADKYKDASLLCTRNIKRFSLESIAPEFENLINNASSG